MIDDVNISPGIEIDSYNIIETTSVKPGLITSGCSIVPDNSNACRTIKVPTDIARFSGGSIPEFQYTVTIKTKDGQ